MKTLPKIIGILLLLVLAGGVLILRYPPKWLQPADAPEADEEVDPQKLEIPVHVAKVTKATLHRYIDAFGAVEPAPPRPGKMAGTADVAAPVAGVISQVLCEAGQQVKKGDALIQLDDRLAVAAEKQAEAGLMEAKASHAKLQAAPRPEQAQNAQLAVDKARAAVAFAEKNLARQQDLAKGGGGTAKVLEQAELDLATAKDELASAEDEQALLKPTPEDYAAEQAKVAAAEAALSAARTQRELLRIVSPIDATVIAVSANPGESVDSTKVLIDLVGLDRLVVNVSIPAGEMASLKVGMPAQLMLGADSTASEGKIYFVGSEVDRKTNAIPVGIDVDPSLGAKPGQSVRVRIVAEEHKDCLAVPKECVVSDENGDSFIATLAGDQATHKTVHVGIREGDLVEIEADGLKEGDSVVSTGAYGLSKFQVAKVKVVEK